MTQHKGSRVREGMQGRTAQGRLPILYIDGERYFIDQRLREFRTVTSPIKTIEFISFDSPRGRRFLEQTVTIPCDLCGAAQLQPSRDIPPDVLCFECAKRWL